MGKKRQIVIQIPTGPTIEDLYDDINEQWYEDATTKLKMKTIRKSINEFPNDKTKETCLHAACRNNCMDIVRRILDIPDVNINIKSVEHGTALDIAIEQGNLELVKLLPRFSAIANGNPIVKAFEKNNSELVELLASRYPEDKYNFVHFRNIPESCENPLYTATERNDLDMIRVLIKLGLTVKLKRITDDEHLQSFGYTFSTALHKATSYFDTEVLKLLLDNYSIYLNYQIIECCDDTLLHTSVRKGNIAAVQLLLSKRVDVEKRNKDGLTPEELARSLNSKKELITCFERFQKEADKMVKKQTESNSCVIL